MVHALAQQLDLHRRSRYSQVRFFKASYLVNDNRHSGGRGDEKLTSNILEILDCFTTNSPAANIIRDAVRGQQEQFGTVSGFWCPLFWSMIALVHSQGMATLVTLIGLLSAAASHLSSQGIPIQGIRCTFREAVLICDEVCRKAAVSTKKFSQEFSRSTTTNMMDA